MMGINKRKVFFLIYILLFAAVLSGFEKRRIELQNNPNTPLIDLDKAIDRAKWGTDSSDGAAADKAADTVSADGVSGNAASGRINTGKSFMIKVRGRSIRLNGTELKDANGLKARLAAEYKNGDSVRLTDDYADADIYREVLNVLNGLAETEGLVYSGDHVER
ncbi:MAG: hypothetical protein J5966_10445 [Lachnospiraceae bacterium]|nr:hypothetical protein [Lachnospiraceae bacterium]